MSKNMLFELKETCNFLDVFRHCSKAPDSLSSGEYPDAQIGHMAGELFPLQGQTLDEGVQPGITGYLPLPGDTA